MWNSLRHSKVPTTTSYLRDPRLTPAHHIDPRLLPKGASHQHANSTGLPLEIVDIICQTLATSSPATLASLAQLNKGSYDTVIPYLYHSITITRSSLSQLLWGADVPERMSDNGNRRYFSYDYSKRISGTPVKEVTITPAVRERRKRCFEHTREVRIEGCLPDVDLSERLARLDHVLYPRCRRLYIDPAILLGLIGWINVKDPDGFRHGIINVTDHPFLKCLGNIVRPTHVEITRGIVTSDAYPEFLGTPESVQRQAKEYVEKLCKGFRVEYLVWHGMTNEHLPRIPGAQHIFHFVKPAPKINYQLMKEDDPAARTEVYIHFDSRVNALRAGLNTSPPESLSTWRICGPSLLASNADTDKERAGHNKMVEKVCHGGDELEALVEGVTRGIEWYTSEEAARLPGASPCDCYGGARVRKMVIGDGDYGVNVAPGVSRSIWDPRMALRRRDI